MPNKVNIAITGTGSLIGQAIIKSIQRSEMQNAINLIGFDYFTETVGSFWCRYNYLLPDLLNPEITEQNWLDCLMCYLEHHQVKLLFVGVDFELAILAKHKAFIETTIGTKIVVSDQEIIQIADDKYLTYQFLKKHNLYHPQSYLPHELDQHDLSYPLVIKPRKGARSVGVSQVNSPAELHTGIALLKNPIIQECVGDNETEYTCGIIYLDDSLKASIALRRTLKSGNTYISHYQKDFPEIITQYIKTIAHYLKPFGACNLQLRLDEHGTPKLFEINARHSGTTYIRSLFGYKEIEYIIQYLIFNREIQFNLSEGTVVRYFEEFFVAP